MSRPMDKLDRIGTADGSLSSPEILCRCIACGVDKPTSEFYPDKYSRNGLRSKCKKCQIAAATTPEALEKKRLRNKENRKKDLCQFMFYAAKCRAKRLGIPFTISKSDIFVPKVCPVLGVELKVGAGLNGDNSPSLDRINPSFGYVPGNIAVISYRANRIKNDATIEELDAVVRYVKSFDNIHLAGASTIVKVVIDNTNNKESSLFRNSAGNL